MDSAMLWPDHEIIRSCMKTGVNCPSPGLREYKSEVGACRVFWKKLLQSTKILFCGYRSKIILPLRGTKTKHNLKRFIIFICD